MHLMGATPAGGGLFRLRDDPFEIPSARRRARHPIPVPPGDVQPHRTRLRPAHPHRNPPGRHRQGPSPARPAGGRVGAARGRGALGGAVSADRPGGRRPVVRGGDPGAPRRRRGREVHPPERHGGRWTVRIERGS